MSKTMTHVLGLMRLELQDVQEDIKALEDLGVQRYRRGEITEYVLKENNALFEGEIHAIRFLIGILTDPKWAQIQSPEEFFLQFDMAVQNHLKDFQYPSAVNSILDRKVRKVREFFLGD